MIAVWKAVVVGCLLGVGTLCGGQAAWAAGQCEASESFIADADTQRMNEAYALDAVDAARANFGVELDWSDESIGAVEEMLGELHEQIASAPSDDAIWSFAKAFGSYTGEVYRRNHGATWGIVVLDGDRFPGMQAAGSCQLFWPWGKAHNRLVNGPEDNVLHYYQVLVRGDPQ